jgi:hypothetical protein
MTNQSTGKAPLPEKQTKQAPNPQEWIVPTLAGLLERFSVTPGNASKPS